MSSIFILTTNPSIAETAVPSLLPASDSFDGGSGVDVHQMDLLSGSIGLLLFAFGLFQAVVFAPTRRTYRAFKSFLKWLEAAIGHDLGATLCSCSAQCDTRSFQHTKEALARRVRSNIDVERISGCIGKKPVTAEDLKAIIDDGGGGALVELARIGGYTGTRELDRAVYLTQSAPRQFETVVLWQWLGIFAHWLIFDAVPSLGHLLLRMAKWVGRVVAWIGLKLHLKRSAAGPDRTSIINYEMLELAKHRIRAQHQPWVRFGLYYMLADLSNKPISIRALGEYHQRGMSEGTQCPLKNEFELASHITTDGCSATRMLYAVSLLSIRSMLLCHNISFVPPYLLAGAHDKWNVVHLRTGFMIENGHINDIYQLMYQLDGDKGLMASTSERLESAYTQLRGKLKGGLGDMICESSETVILCNLLYAYKDFGEVQRAMAATQGAPLDTSVATKSFALARIDIDPALLVALYRRMYVDNGRIRSVLGSNDMLAVHWGTRVWLLQLFLTGYLSADDAFDRESKCFAQPSEVRSIFRAACAIPFQPEIPPSPGYGKQQSSSTPLTLIEQRMFDAQDLMPDKPQERACLFHSVIAKVPSLKSHRDGRWFSRPPLWCTCPGHCSGACTLTIDWLDMQISAPLYWQTPYWLTALTDYDDEVEETLEYRIMPRIPLICSTNISALKFLIDTKGWGEISETSSDDGSTAGSPQSNLADVHNRKGTRSRLGGLLHRRNHCILVASRGRLYEWHVQGNSEAGASNSPTTQVPRDITNYFRTRHRITVGGRDTYGDVYFGARTAATKDTDGDSIYLGGTVGLCMSRKAWRRSASNAPNLD